MELISKFRSDLNKIWVSSQGKGYVDDFWVKNLIPGQPEETYYQLKTSTKLSWGKKAKQPSLFYDFYKQQENLTKKGVSFLLGLVVSQKKIYQSMTSRLPKALNKVCSVHHYPWRNSIEKQVTHCSAFRKAAVELCAFPETDKLQALVSYFVGAWVSSSKSNISLDKLFINIHSKGAMAFLKSPIPLSLSPQVVMILDAIPDFRYQIVHGYLAYYYGSSDKGTVPYMINSEEFRNIESEIIANRPATFADLETIIL